MSKKLTIEEVIKRVHSYNPNITIIGEYQGGSKRIDCICEKCENQWKPIASNIMNGENCPICANNNRIKKLTGNLDQFIEQLSKINPDVEVIGKYKNKNTKVLCRCKVCQHEWNVLPSKLLRGQHCPNCANKHRNDNRRKTHEEFIKELAGISPNIDVLDRYKNIESKILVHCKDCSYEWETAPINLLVGKNCPKCSAKKNGLKCRKAHETFIQELNNINDTIEVLGQYVTNRTKIECKCKCCGSEFWATPHSLLSRKGCPVCYLSLGELSIRTYLKNHNIDFVHQKKFANLRGEGGKPLSYDFYLPNQNLLIEFQGKQHKEPVEIFGGETNFKRVQTHDARKRQYAKDNNIRLLEIWYYDYLKISEILSNTLNNGACTN